MAVGWSKRRESDGEPATPSTPYIIADVGFDPANPDAIVFAWKALEPVPYAAPDELQDDVIDPTAIFKPWVPSGFWKDCVITVENDME